MTTIRLVGKDTIKINDRILADFGPGEVGKLSFSTDIVTVKTGKNGNTIYAANETGNQATLVVSVIRGSEDDKALNTLMTSQKSDLPKWVMMNGELVKNLGDGQGNTISDTYILTGGVFTKNLDTTSNVEGDTAQAIVAYTMQFAVAPRAIA
jgi:hypothetical protein